MKLLAIASMFFCCLLAPSTSNETEFSLLHQDLHTLLQPQTLGLMALGVGGAYLAHHWDDDLRGEVSDSQPLKTLFDLGNYYGSTTYGVLATGGLWTFSRLAHRRGLQPVASEVLRALTLSNAMVSPFKFAVARKRPDGSNGLSFPSGHSANSFALTTVLTRRYGWRLGLPLYAFTATVPLARIHANKHFFSDVFGGAVIGIIAGWSVTRPKEGRGRVELVPEGGPGYFLLSARQRF